MRAQRNGGKGKGKDWNNVAPRQWNTWNPGFINKQWSNWRPGYGGKGEKGFKGKGKGDGGSGGKGSGGIPDLNKLSFPPLCAVSPQQQDGSYDEPWGYGGQGDGLQHDWTGGVNSSGGWIGQASKKREKIAFERTEEFKDTLHCAQAWKGTPVKNMFAALETITSNDERIQGVYETNEQLQKN